MELIPLPSTGNPKENITLLTNKLNEWSVEYHIYDKPIVSDYTYDVWFNQLLDLEAKYPQFRLPYSPTLRVGEKITHHDKVTRELPMLSLENVFSKEELTDWVRLNLPAEGVKLVLEPKVDGLAVSLIYKDGILVDASTRGDGLTGERVLDAVRTIRDIPLKIKIRGKIEVRGEVYFKKSRFKEINNALPESEQYKHPRNLASATLKMKDIEEIRRRKLSFKPYTYISEEVQDHIRAMLGLEKNGFDRYLYATCHSNNEVLHARVVEFSEMLTKSDIPFDGVVLKVIDIPLQKKLGGSVRAPKWGVAYKLQENIAHAVLKDVRYQVGRTGLITPVAVIEPTLLSGAVIENITLHNFNIIKELGLGIGDTISIIRSGEVIPKVLGVVKRNHKNRLSLPSICPCCLSPLRYEGRYAYCTNQSEYYDECIDTELAKRQYIYSKEVLNIKHLGDEYIESLHRSRMLKHPVDIFTLSVDNITSCATASDLVSKKIYKSIQNAKQIEDYRIVLALCIPTIGKEKAKIISGILQGDLSRLNEIGEVSKQAVLDWLSNGGETEIRKYLNYITPKTKQVIMTGKYAGKNILITGSFETYTRKQLIWFIESQGGKVVSSPSVTTDYALIGVSPSSSKFDKVLKLNIPQLTLEDVL